MQHDPFTQYIESDTFDISPLGQYQPMPAHERLTSEPNLEQAALPVLVLALLPAPIPRLLPVGVQTPRSLWGHLRCWWHRAAAYWKR